MNTFQKYRCKRYNGNSMTCYKHIYTTIEQYRRCPIRIHNMFPKYEGLEWIPCSNGIIKIDWVEYIRLKEILDEYFINM